MIKAINTKHNGYLFRSRLEARWAVFFDTLGIEYWYEHEGYDLGGRIWYLPDFYLPALDIFYEIKPVWPTEEEEEKAQCLRVKTGKKTFIAWGNIPYKYSTTEAGIISYNRYTSQGQYKWVDCPECGNIGLIPFGDTRRMQHTEVCDMTGKNPFSFGSERIINAYEAARSARF